MRQLLPILLTMLAVLFYQCGGEEQVQGTVIRGEIEGAAGLQVFIDEVGIGNSAAQILEKTEADGSGNFEFSFPEGIDPGIYRIRIGTQKMSLVFDGEENLVTVQGQLQNMQKYDMQIKGAPSSTVYANTIQALISREMQAGDIETFVDTTSSPFVAMLVALQAIGPNGQYLDIHKNAQARLAKAYPASDDAQTYGEYINQVERQYAQQLASQRVKVGQPAPEITLPTPDGKEYSLSDLKGKVVLLDFWASWCGPCRRANPKVVEAYQKYKDKGFTVFSVSLDGVHPRQMARIETDAQLQELTDRSKQKWIAAIEKDGLAWPYHVSDLKYWQSEAAVTYGVNSIPRTFLIDREGKIAEVGVNPLAQDIESMLEQYL